MYISYIYIYMGLCCEMAYNKTKCAYLIYMCEQAMGALWQPPFSPWSGPPPFYFILAVFLEIKQSGRVLHAMGPDGQV